METLKREDQQLLVDQLTLQDLHEQLASQYEGLVIERDSLRVNLREARTEIRSLNESAEKFTSALSSLRHERDNLSVESTSLNNLRAEHSKLKV